jgi:WD40 repeat protein
VWTLPLAHPDEPHARWMQRRATAFAYAPDGKTLAAGCEGGRVLLVDPITGTVQRRLDTVLLVDPITETATETFLALFYTPDGRHLVLVTGPAVPGVRYRGSALRVWDLEQGRQLRHVRLPVLAAVALAPDGRYLAGVADDVRCSPAAVAFWDMADGSAAGTLEWDTEDLLRDLTFAADGQTLATTAASGTVKLWPWRLLLGV